MLDLQRSDRDRMLLGVCGGIAERFGLGAAWLRLAFVIAAFASGIGVAVYIVLALAMLPPGSSEATIGQRARLNLLHLRASLTEAADRVEHWRRQRQLGADTADAGRTIIGALVVLIGLFMLLWSFGLFWWLTFWRTLGLVAVLVGIALLMPTRTRAAAPRGREPSQLPATRRGQTQTPGAGTAARGSLTVVAFVTTLVVVTAGAGVAAIDIALEDEDDGDWVRDIAHEAQNSDDVEALRTENERAWDRVADLERRIDMLEALPGVLALAGPDRESGATPRARPRRQSKSDDETARPDQPASDPDLRRGGDREWRDLLDVVE